MSESRNRTLVRSWRILQRLVARKYGLSINELARDEGVTTRTIRRDLAALEAAGFPIVRVDYRHGGVGFWSCLPNGWPMLQGTQRETLCDVGPDVPGGGAV